MLKRLLILLVTSPFLAAFILLGSFLSDWGSRTCTGDRAKAVAECEQRHESDCPARGETAFSGCMSAYGYQHNIGTVFSLGAVFLILGIVFGFRNVLIVTLIIPLASMVAMTVLSVLSGGVRRR